jgi:hypothetical protein
MSPPKRPIHTLAAILAAAACAHADTVLTPSKDTYVHSANGNTNYGGDTGSMITNWNSSSRRYALFSYDISAVGSAVGGVKLDLRDVIGNAGTKSYEIYGLLDAHDNWAESTLTWNTAGFISDGTFNLAAAYGGVKLGDFNTAQNAAFTAFDVASGAHVDFVNANRVANGGNGIITYIIVDPANDAAGTGWATRESANTPATLTLAAVDDPEPLAYFPFDANIADASGNGYHGTLVDAGTIGNSGITNTAGDFKSGGGAMDFSSDADYLAIPAINLSATAADGWAVAFWARQRDTTNNSKGMVVGNTGNAQDFIWIDSAVGTGGGLRYRNTASQNANFLGFAEDTVWHHYAVVYHKVSGGTGDITLYRDGSVHSTIPGFAGSLAINGIGQAYNADWPAFFGQIDELYIYAAAISAAKVGELYAGDPDTTPPTIAGAGIVDNRGGGPVATGTVVTYTVTFSEPMDAATIDAADFSNAGDAPVDIGTVAQTSPGFFSVPVIPTGTGLLRLQINPGAVLADLAGNLLDTGSAIIAATGIEVLEAPPPLPLRLIRVFLVGGQSNADGRAVVTDLPTSPVNLRLPQDDIDFYHKVENKAPALTTLRPGLSETNQFGPEITLGRRLADALADGAASRVAIIKYANGGTNLNTQWKGGGNSTTTGDGPEYLVFQQTVAGGLAALAAAYPGTTIQIEGMLWVQGESDAGAAAAYQANLANFITDIRATYGANLWFIISRLSSGQTSINAAALATLRAAQDAVAAADPLASLLNTDGFGMKTDNLHFDAVGQQQIGSAAAALLLEFRPFTSQPRISLQAGGDLAIQLDDVFPGFLYTLRSSSTLQEGSWQFEESIAAASTSIQFIVTPDLRRFYRIGRAHIP